MAGTLVWLGVAAATAGATILSRALGRHSMPTPDSQPEEQQYSRPHALRFAPTPPSFFSTPKSLRSATFPEPPAQVPAKVSDAYSCAICGRLFHPRCYGGSADRAWEAWSKHENHDRQRLPPAPPPPPSQPVQVPTFIAPRRRLSSPPLPRHHSAAASSSLSAQSPPAPPCSPQPGAASSHQPFSPPMPPSALLLATSDPFAADMFSPQSSAGNSPCPPSKLQQRLQASCDEEAAAENIERCCSPVLLTAAASAAPAPAAHKPRILSHSAPTLPVRPPTGMWVTRAHYMQKQLLAAAAGTAMYSSVSSISSDYSLSSSCASSLVSTSPSGPDVAYGVFCCNSCGLRWRSGRAHPALRQGCQACGQRCFATWLWVGWKPPMKSVLEEHAKLQQQLKDSASDWPSEEEEDEEFQKAAQRMDESIRAALAAEDARKMEATSEENSCYEEEVDLAAKDENSPPASPLASDVSLGTAPLDMSGEQACNADDNTEPPWLLRRLQSAPASIEAPVSSTSDGGGVLRRSQLCVDFQAALPVATPSPPLDPTCATRAVGAQPAETCAPAMAEPLS